MLKTRIPKEWRLVGISPLSPKLHTNSSSLSPCPLIILIKRPEQLSGILLSLKSIISKDLFMVIPGTTASRLGIQSSQRFSLRILIDLEYPIPSDIDYQLILLILRSTRWSWDKELLSSKFLPIPKKIGRLSEGVWLVFLTSLLMTGDSKVCFFSSILE